MIVAAFALAMASAAAAPLKCGVCTSDFPENVKALGMIAETGKLDFWWNWATEPKIDTSSLTPEVAALVNEAFDPMIWGQGEQPSYEFLTNASFVHGYNEPDLYGPPCVGDWDPPQYGCSPGDYRAATSSGWAPLFDPQSAALLWQEDVNRMTRINPSLFNHGQKIVSPSMAMGAEATVNCYGVDPAVDGAIKRCPGWLGLFKEATLGLECTDFNGSTTNCWDVIDVLSIHGYAKEAADILGKIDGYRDVFADDFDGANGRKEKTLWLTEVAMGSSDGDAIVGFVDDLMNAETGLTNRVKYDFVEKVSWFSVWSFFAFELDDELPENYEAWSSTLFNPYGSLSQVGEAFFSYC
jgi:hypothetical protein